MEQFNARLAQLEVIQPIMTARIDDHEDRLRKVEHSVAKISAYVSVAAVAGSILGQAILALF